MRLVRNLPIVMLCLMILAAGCASGDEIRAQKLRYVNVESGFEINFPENWQSYKVVPSDEYISTDIKVRSFLVCLPTRSRDWQSDRVEGSYAVIFSVLIFSAQSWDLLNAKYGGAGIRYTLLGTSGNKVFVMRYASSLPVDLYQYMKEIDKVAAKFAVIKQD